MTSHKRLRSFTSLNLVLLFFFIFSGSSLQAQPGKRNIKFTNISIKNGLSQSSANCIFQDSRGILWVGTEDGLNKYDGYSFAVYKSNSEDISSISNPRIQCIIEDHSGNLWIGTNGGGLNKYIRNVNRFYSVTPGNHVNSEHYKQVQCLFDADSVIWTGTKDGLALVHKKSMKFMDVLKGYPALAPLASVSIHKIISTQLTLWFGTEKGLFSYNLQNNKLVFYTSTKYPYQNLDVTALISDHKGTIIIGSDRGLFILDRSTNDIIQVTVQRQENSRIKVLMEDIENNLWVGTMSDGLFVGSVYSGSFENYSYDHLNPYSIKNNEILSLYEDYSGIVWVGSNGLDLYNPKKEKFTLYDYVPYSREQLIFRNIHPIYEDHSGVLWIGSKTDGLHILDRNRKSYSRFLKSNGLSSNGIRAIKEFPEGVLWVGTEDQGLNKVFLDGNRKPVRVVQYKSVPGKSNCLTSNKIYALYADEQGQLWIGTDNGLTVMDPVKETFKQYFPDENKPGALSNGTVYSIFCDSRKMIWLATDLGVNKYDAATNTFIRYVHQEKNNNSIIHNEILCFHEDDKGFLWIGTYGKGFDKFDPVHEKFFHYRDINEVSTAVIYGILEDEQDNLWLSTNNGILMFNKSTNKIKAFDIEDGLQSNEFNGTSYYKSLKGEMFFGGQYGFNSFFPDAVKVDSVVPKIIISDILVNNVSVIPGEKAPIDRNINEAREIILRHQQNNITLYFSGLHFANPLRNKYKYKLEGFDKEWIDAGNKRFVSYTNLPYQTYTFYVRASNSDGIWNNQGMSIKIKVKAPFWATIWFRILCGLVLAGLIFYLIRNRLSREERQKKIIEDKFNASSKELEVARQQLENQHEEIVIQKRELFQSQKDQESLLWFNQGLGLFSDLISKNRESLSQLCGEFIEKLVDYVEAQQGGIFLFQQDDEEMPLHLVAHYAYSISRQDQKISVGEGYVGTCYKEMKFLEIDNLTDRYSVLNSGLGNMPVKHLVLAPLMVNNNCIGVIELGSFKKIKGYRISFIEKLVETFASTILTEQANNRLKILIEQSTLQAKELSENEEKLRKNLEELMAAQDESSNREDELIKMAEEAATREEMMSQEIEMLKNQIGLLSSQPSSN